VASKRGKWLGPFVFVISALLALRSTSVAAAYIQVCFTPEYGSLPSCTQRIVNVIGSAKRNILVQAYAFTSASIARALTDAHGRGVDVKVLLDRRANTGRYSDATYLERMGVSVSIDSGHAIAHNKVVIIDGATVITGSFNFTKAAEERNAENVLIIYDPALAEQYVKNWKLHAAHSQPFAEREVGRQNPPVPDVADAEQDDSKIQQGLPPQVQIVGNRRSGIYAWLGCASYDTVSPANRVLFSEQASG
jgi:phosphatidylserine/phosphatidylglycerophosphate/cardiolipin synthase-like enzyme